jgi:cation:H+ antiporter
VLLYLFYIVTVVREGRAIRARGEIIRKEAEEGPHAPAWLLLVGGLGLVYLGANLLVDGGVRILQRTGLSAGFVGAAIIGALAAADEVLLETLPVLRGMPGLATGNLFGTVAAFSTGVIGLAALIHPLIVDAAATSAFLAAAVLYTIVAVAFLVRGRAGRLVGLIVLVAYGLWLALSYRF